MATQSKRTSRKAGMPPGTLVHIGAQRVAKARITVMDYDETRCEEKDVADIAECFPFRDTPTVTWINLTGLHDVELVERLGAHYNLHPLILEDILNTAERPKVEDYGDYVFVVLKLFIRNGRPEEKMHQVSLVLGPGVVISFEETESGLFESLRERIRKGKGRLRKMGPDYLAYAIIDGIVDSYFGVLERLGEEVEDIEDELVLDPKRELLQKIHALKREMIYLRKSAWPLREVINGLERLDTPLIKPTTDVYLRDVYDHTVQIIDTMETSRDILSGMLETYLSSVSNRMNEVMKVLTIIATIFIPLTFIAGVYGMNFKVMPELEWPWGYGFALALMAVVGGVMVVYFKRKKWF